MRYFYVSFGADNGAQGGCCTLTATKFINLKKFIKDIKELHPSLVNPCIYTWVEMTEEDYLVFTNEEESNE